MNTLLERMDTVNMKPGKRRKVQKRERKISVTTKAEYAIWTHALTSSTALVTSQIRM